MGTCGESRLTARFPTMREEALCDPAAADDLVVLVEHSRLSGRDGALRRIENGRDLIARQHFQFGPGGLVPVADFYLDAQLSFELRDGDPVQPLRL